MGLRPQTFSDRTLWVCNKNVTGYCEICKLCCVRVQDVEQHDNVYGGALNIGCIQARRTLLMMETANVDQSVTKETIQDYVAQLQLHMALQAKNLVPSFTQSNDPRQQLLHETQATVEKLVSRQSL